MVDYKKYGAFAHRRVRKQRLYELKVLWLKKLKSAGAYFWTYGIPSVGIALFVSTAYYLLAMVG